MGNCKMSGSPRFPPPPPPPPLPWTWWWWWWRPWPCPPCPGCPPWPCPPCCSLLLVVSVLLGESSYSHLFWDEAPPPAEEPAVEAVEAIEAEPPDRGCCTDSWLGFTGARFNMPLTCLETVPECWGWDWCWFWGCWLLRTVVPIMLPSPRPLGTTTSVCKSPRNNGY